MTTTHTTAPAASHRAHEIATQLDTYMSDHTDPTTSNIWQDLILRLPEYDEEYTDQLVAAGRGAESSIIGLSSGWTITYSRPVSGFQWTVGVPTVEVAYYREALDVEAGAQHSYDQATIDYREALSVVDELLAYDPLAPDDHPAHLQLLRAGHDLQAAADALDAAQHEVSECRYAAIDSL